MSFIAKAAKVLNDGEMLDLLSFFHYLGSEVEISVTPDQEKKFWAALFKALEGIDGIPEEKISEIRGESLVSFRNSVQKYRTASDAQS